jgi:hypothetical protein
MQVLDEFHWIIMALCISRVDRDRVSETITTSSLSI